MSINFKKKNLGEVSEIIAGQSPPSSSYNNNNDGLPFFQGKVDFGDEYPSVRVWCNEPSKIELPNDIVISVRAPVGPTNICNVKSCIGRGLSAIRAKEDNHYKYLFYFLRYKEKELANMGRGSTFSAITQDDLKEIYIPVPSLSVQKQIAYILDKADSIRKKRQQSIRLADEFLRSTFLDMFGDPVNNRKCFTIKRLSEICTKITDGTHATPERLKKGVKFITGKHIRQFFIDYENSDYVTKEIHEEIFRRCNPEYGDILYTNIGANVGTAAMNIVKYEFSMKNVALLKPDYNVIASHFVEHVLNFPNMKDSILNKASLGGAQQFMSLAIINNIILPIPPIGLQNQFSRIVEQTEKDKRKHKLFLTESENLFNSLMQKAFSDLLLEV